MIFAAPWVLVALPALPLLWWLLRVTPPAPRSQTFPAIRLLAGLHAKEETPARTPWWLLALRMLAATLIIVGLARPILDAGALFPGSGPVLLVIDNGWAAAADWPRRMQAAGAALDRAERGGRKAALLATAPNGSGTVPQASAPMPVPELRARLAALQPEPWPPDHNGAAAALRAWKQPGTAIVYVADGLVTHRCLRGLRGRARRGRVSHGALLRRPARPCAATATRRGGSLDRAAGADTSARADRGCRARAKRRRPHPRSRDADHPGRRDEQRGGDRPSARIAQSPEPPRPGGTSLRRLRRAAG